MEVQSDLEWAQQWEKCHIPNEEEFIIAMEECLREEFDTSHTKIIEEMTTGFCNKSAVYEINHQKYFVKYNADPMCHQRFLTENESLKLIQGTNIIPVPEAKKVLKFQKGSCHVIEYWDGLRNLENHWQDLGTKLARLHLDNINCVKASKVNETNIHKGGSDMQPVTQFGFHQTTFYGVSISTPPAWEETWADYFNRHILENVFLQAEGKSGQRDLIELWSELQLYVGRAFNDTVILPSLIHGDICSVNVGERNNEAVIFDPQCSYAHSLFEFYYFVNLEPGIFKDDFFTAYHTLIPKTKEHDLHMTLYALFINLSSYIHGLGDMYKCKAIENGKSIISMIQQQIQNQKK